MANIKECPISSTPVEIYTGTNPHKQGTAFCQACGVRLDAQTGDLLPGQSISGTALTSYDSLRTQQEIDALRDQLNPAATAELEHRASLAEAAQKDAELALHTLELEVETADKRHSEELQASLDAHEAELKAIQENHAAEIKALQEQLAAAQKAQPKQ